MYYKSHITYYKSNRLAFAVIFVKLIKVNLQIKNDIIINRNKMLDRYNRAIIYEKTFEKLKS